MAQSGPMNIFGNPAEFRLDDLQRRRFGVEPGWSFGTIRRARWQEVDGFGHVNNIAYSAFYEDARNHYLEFVGLPPLSAETPGPVIVQTSEKFFKPLLFKDTFMVTARNRRLGNTSLSMDYAVWSNGLVASGDAVIVLMISATGEKIRIPDSVRAAIVALDAPEGGHAVA